MADLNVEGASVAPGVVETIVALAANEVEGVAGVGSPATNGLFTILGGGKPPTQGIEVEAGDDDKLNVSVRLWVKSGQILPDVAAAVRRAIADAVQTQVGAQVAAVDIFIDGVQFDD